MNRFSYWSQVVAFSLFSQLAWSGPSLWDDYPIYNEAPLEAKLGTFFNGDSPDLLGVVLWSSGANSNHLEAIRIPPPYDGTGLSSVTLESSASIFALGDICTEGNNVVVPYIKNFNVEVARFNGSNWSTSTLPGTTTNNFDNADCGTTTDGMFILTHDLTDSESEIFTSDDGGSNYTFYGRYTASGPFDGAIREPLATNYSQRRGMTVSQLPNGQVRATRFNTALNPPVFGHSIIENLSPPQGFTFVKESSGASYGDRFIFTYNSEGTANVLDILFPNMADRNEDDLGMVSGSGTQFNFFGTNTQLIEDIIGEAMGGEIIWQFYAGITELEYPLVVTHDPSYPLDGVGGPVDGCQLNEFSGPRAVGSETILIGPRVGSSGTNVYTREIRGDAIFADGFESGDVSAWRVSCD